jgi:hypothetical protein
MLFGTRLVRHAGLKMARLRAKPRIPDFRGARFIQTGAEPQVKPR